MFAIVNRSLNGEHFNPVYYLATCLLPLSLLAQLFSTDFTMSHLHVQTVTTGYIACNIISTSLTGIFVFDEVPQYPWSYAASVVTAIVLTFLFIRFQDEVLPKERNVANEKLGDKALVSNPPLEIEEDDGISKCTN